MRYAKLGGAARVRPGESLNNSSGRSSARDSRAIRARRASRTRISSAVSLSFPQGFAASVSAGHRGYRPALARNFCICRNIYRAGITINNGGEETRGLLCLECKGE